MSDAHHIGNRGISDMQNGAQAMVVAAALALAACGSESPGGLHDQQGESAGYSIDKATGQASMTIKGKDGDATLRAGAAVPVILPDGFSLFPGTRVVDNAVVTQPDGQGTLITFEADAPAEQIVAHYRDAAMQAGFDIQIEMDTNGTQMVGAERKADGATFSVTATAGKPTSGQIIIAAKTG
jgi:hypothetical protein